MKKLIDSASILAIGTALLYCFSTAFYNGVLSAFDLDSQLLERSVHQVLYYGLFVVYMPLLWFVAFITIGLSIWAHLIFPAILNFFRQSYRNKRWFVRFRRFLSGGQKDTELEIEAKMFSSNVSLILLFLFLFILSLAHFEGEGREHGNKFLEDIAKATGSQKVLQLDISGEVKESYLLACGVNNCASVDINSQDICYFPRSNTFKISEQATPKVIKQP